VVPKYLPHQGWAFFDTVRQGGNPISANSRKKKSKSKEFGSNTCQGNLSILLKKFNQRLIWFIYSKSKKIYK
jgi:hypothetical protein